MGVLLELLDPKQNATFVDHYIDFPFDLSNALFIATANNTQTISTAVLDRLEVIQMPSYTDDQKIHIAKDYILPRLLKETGLVPESVSITDGVWQAIARASGFDPGIRSVERKVESIVRSVAFKTVQGAAQSFSVNEANMNEFVEQ
jgi:ATP-dependent Lon protease